MAAAVLASLPASALGAPTPTPASKAQAAPTPTQAKGKPAPTAVLPSPTPTDPPPTATRVPPTATATPPPAATATSVPTRQVTPSAPPAPTAPPASTSPPAPTQKGTQTPTVPTPEPSPVATAATAGAAASTGAGTIQGRTFLDANADGQLGDGEEGLGQVGVKLTYANGLSRTVVSDDTGAFVFDGLPPGTYHVNLSVPTDYVPTTDPGQDVEVVQDADTDSVHFGLISNDAAGLTPDASGPEATSDDEQIIALASVTSLPLRFAQGRDLMAQVQKRVLGDGLVWLGVPFRTQIDGGVFQYVNCGPASLTMVLAGFGLEVGPSQVRDYLNNLIDNFDTDLGTSLDALSRIAREAGLTPMDLYSDTGGYRNWSTDAVRWHVQQGHPVITLVKYRNLPGHTSSLSEFDHYIVISGLTPNGFVYNDAAFSTTLGYGLEISDLELEYAWNNSSIPHHAVALGLDPDKKALSFPELPRKRQAVAEASTTARAMRRLADADETDSERTPLLSVAPFMPAAPPVAAETTTAAAPLIGESDRWQDDPSFDVEPPTEAGTPMGLTIEPSDQPTLEPRPGPGTEVPKLLTLVGGAWLLWSVWSLSGAIARRAPTFAFVRAAAVAVLGLFRGGA
jgi:SdrD B-like domain/Peptidase_C39 like family